MRYLNLDDPASWEQGGGVFVNVGRGGGGHGGGHGGHGGHGHGGFGFVYADPFPYWYEDDYSEVPWEPDPRVKHRVTGDSGLLSTGEGALIVLGVLWWLTSEANKRVPR